jgi:tagaturonate reductase
VDLRPRLSRDLAASPMSQQRRDVEIPPVDTLELPERAIQFGTGAFLRGFVEYFVDAANRRGLFNGTIVAVSSTGSGRDELLNEQDGLYTLAIRGLENGLPVQRYRVVGSLSRALSAQDDWSAVLAVARDPNVELVFSNTTEVGIAIDENDQPHASPPRSFPAKLTCFLYERAVAFDYDAARGLVVLPCELVENNGARLSDLVRELAERWSGMLDPRFMRWLDDAVIFCNTLVDRIVTGTPEPEEAGRLRETLAYRDGLITVCESYRLFAIEGGDRLRARLPFAAADDGVVVTPSIRGFRERKVRVLNGAHTIVAPAALLSGLETVQQAVEDERIGRFLRSAIFDEIVPSLSVPGGDAFANDVLQRFANPFIHHALIDITLQATMKMSVRVIPSIVELYDRTGRTAAGLAFGFAAYLLFIRGDFQAQRRESGLRVPEDAQADAVRRHWHGVDTDSDEAISALVTAVCADRSLWEGVDLTDVPGFGAAVAEHLRLACRQSVPAALDAFLASYGSAERKIA